MINSFVSINHTSLIESEISQIFNNQIMLFVRTIEYEEKYLAFQTKKKKKQRSLPQNPLLTSQLNFQNCLCLLKSNILFESYHNANYSKF